MTKYNEEIVNKVKEMRLAGIKYMEIANILQLTYRAVKGIIELHNLRLTTQERLSENEKQFIINTYEQGFNGIYIARKLNRSNATISKFLLTNKIETNHRYSKYKKNVTFFDEINTEEKAYFLGFLYADGCNNLNSNYRIKISLQEGDKHILEKFSELIFNTKDKLIYIIKKKEKGWNRRNQWSLEINCKYMSNKLAKHGMTNNKSFNLQFPKCVPVHLIRHFMRGYFDGDGSITFIVRDNKSPISRCTIISSIEFCKEFDNQLKLYLGIGMPLYLANNYSQPMANLVTGGNQKVFKILSFLYKDSTIYLNRKYEKYLQLKAYIEKEARIAPRLDLIPTVTQAGTSLLSKGNEICCPPTLITN